MGSKIFHNEWLHKGTADTHECTADTHKGTADTTWVNFSKCNPTDCTVAAVDSLLCSEQWFHSNKPVVYFVVWHPWCENQFDIWIRGKSVLHTYPLPTHSSIHSTHICYDISSSIISWYVADGCWLVVALLSPTVVVVAGFWRWRGRGENTEALGNSVACVGGDMLVGGLI